MHDLNNVGRLFRHMEWADAEIWKSVIKHSSANDDSKLRKILLHIHMVQMAFFHVWTKQPLDFPEETDFPDLAGIAKWGYEYHKQFKDYLSSLNKKDLDRIVEIPWANRIAKITGRKPDNPTFEETMLQVVMHSTYHRGQVSARLRELGGEPPPNDFIYWIWLGKPGAVWEDVKT